jgi:hypothetical protein
MDKWIYNNSYNQAPLYTALYLVPKTYSGMVGISYFNFYAHKYVFVLEGRKVGGLVYGYTSDSSTFTGRWGWSRKGHELVADQEFIPYLLKKYENTKTEQKLMAYILEKKD